jgi:hypothetical protein
MLLKPASQHFRVIAGTLIAQLSTNHSVCSAAGATSHNAPSGYPRETHFIAAHSGALIDR